MALTNYHGTCGNYREQLRANARRTSYVIVAFVLIYTFIGLIVDVFVLQSRYPQASVPACLYALYSFQIPPLATLTMLALAGISILITFLMYDKIMLLGTDAREITRKTANNLMETQLYNVVEEMKVASSLHYMPKVYIINANYMNAFASGFSEKSAMIAITRGLMEKLTRSELQAVMAHELSHIRHNDTKLILVVAVLSNILLIVVDILFYATIYGRGRRNDNRLFMIVIILRYLLPLITLVLALFLSRSREYMADAGAVELMRDNEPMARALLKISQDYTEHEKVYTKDYAITAHEQVRQASYLFDPTSVSRLSSTEGLFSSHPSIEKRLRALGFKK